MSAEETATLSAAGTDAPPRLPNVVGSAREKKNQGVEQQLSIIATPAPKHGADDSRDDDGCKVNDVYDDEDKESLVESCGGSASSTTSDSSASTESSTSSDSMSTLLSESSSDDDSSILSSSSDDDLSSSSADSCDSASEFGARMERRFRVRDRVLKKLARGKSEAYVDFLRENEMAVRREAAKLVQRKRKVREAKKRSAAKAGRTDGDGAGRKPAENGRGPPTSVWTARSTKLATIAVAATKDETTGGEQYGDALNTQRRNLAGAFYRLVLFDFYHSVPGFATLLLYCLAHISVYELLSNIFLELTKNAPDQNRLYAATLVSALFLSRISGGVWSWVNDDRYSCVKFDMHNRLRRNEIDARLLRWFRRHSRVQLFFHVLSLYMLFITCFYFVQNVVLPAFLDIRSTIMEEESLPSLRYGFCNTGPKETLFGSGISSSCSALDLGNFKGEKACFNDKSDLVEGGEYCYNTTELASALTDEDSEYIMSKVSIASYYAFFGDATGALFNPWSIILFYSTTAALSISLLLRSGVNFW